ncbi:hypothetical protein C3942_01855 [Solimonas fluminis]|uniref:Uncharacterized protein n=1 Tax=Solimonas fluminis TaxID=2086571 RepID=A0A2S5TL04_9GAMM|nr:hypothetical protein C3942_01855 [Solimonas fluminis]
MSIGQRLFEQIQLNITKFRRHCLHYVHLHQRSVSDILYLIYALLYCAPVLNACLAELSDKG